MRDRINQLRQRVQHPRRAQELIMTSPAYRSANAYDQSHLFQISLNTLVA